MQWDMRPKWRREKKPSGAGKRGAAAGMGKERNRGGGAAPGERKNALAWLGLALYCCLLWQIFRHITEKLGSLAKFFALLLSKLYPLAVQGFQVFLCKIRKLQ